MENNTLPAEVQEQIRLQAERLYNDLDQAAREYDPHEYGLPMVENHTWHIEAALTEWAQWKVKYDELKEAQQGVWVKACDLLPGWGRPVKWRHESGKELHGTHTLGDMTDRSPVSLHGFEWYNESTTSNYSALKERAEKLLTVLESIVHAPVPANGNEYISWFITAKNIAGGAISEWNAVEQIAAWKEGEKEEGK